MKNEQKYNIHVATKAAKILYAQACKGAELRSARLKSGELAVMVYLNITPAPPCNAYGCGATHICEGCGRDADEVAIANVERYSELVQDLYYIGEAISAVGRESGEYLRVQCDLRGRKKFGRDAHECLLAHIAEA